MNLRARRIRGFTMIELAVVLMIVVILAMIAIPSYREHVVRGKLTEATAELSAGAIQAERWFQDRRPPTYAGLPFCAGKTTDNFTYSCQGVPDANGYVLQAVGRGAMAGFGYTVDQSNTRTSSVPTGSGWSVHSPNNCWITKKGGQC